MASNRAPSSLIRPPSRESSKSLQVATSAIQGHVRARLSSTENSSIPSREVAATRVRSFSKRSTSPAQTVLSAYGPNRKKQAGSPNLMDQIREFLPVTAVAGGQQSREKLTAEQLEDKEAELRRLSAEQPHTGWHQKVYRTSKWALLCAKMGHSRILLLTIRF